MRDLEIRGAGNILGPEQSGHIATVGYEMYCQLLEEATRQLKNEPKPDRCPRRTSTSASRAFIPKTYIPGDRQRMDVYRRLTRCTDLEMLDAAGAGHEGRVRRAAAAGGAALRADGAAAAGRASTASTSIIKKDPDVVLTVRMRGKARVRRWPAHRGRCA